MAAAASRIATVNGVALRPGVSKNGRHYTREAIGRAHDRLSGRLADPAGRPVTMRSHHPGSKSDLAVTNISGRLTSVSLDESGALLYTADIPDTAAGRDVAALVVPDPETGKAYLANVSIRGWWVGEPIQTAEGWERGEDLEIDGLDFTPNPGVDGAVILAAAYENSDTTEAANGRRLITESVEDPTVITTTEAAKYADPGYKADDRKRFPMDTKAQVIVGLAHLSEDAGHEGYTPAQVRRMKGKLRNALREHGVDLASKTSLAETAQEFVDEAYASINLDNGAADVRVSGWINDPTDLAATGQRMALAALAALAQLDPDSDGDIDLGEPEESDRSTTSSTAVAEADNKEASAMSDTTKATTAEETKPEADKPAEENKETAPVASLSEDDRRAIVADVVAALKPATEDTPSADKPAEESTTETKAPAEALAEAFKLGVTEGVKAAKTELRDEVTALFRAGGRKGLIRTEESGEPPKPLHEMSDEEFRAYSADRWSSVMPNAR